LTRAPPPLPPGGGGGGYSDNGLPWIVDSGFAHSTSVVPCQNEGNRCLQALAVDEDGDVVGSAVVGGADLGGAPVAVVVEVMELEYVPGTRAMAFRKGSVSSRSGEVRARGEMLTRAAAHHIAGGAWGPVRVYRGRRVCMRGKDEVSGSSDVPDAESGAQGAEWP
jgi:hypothetical protein